MLYISVVRRAWSEEEKAAVKNHFAKYLLIDQLPGKADIVKILERDEVLQHRSWKNIKDYIRNNKKTH